MELSDTLRTRRSHRSFTKEPVSRDTLAELIRAGRQAPSSCNLQLTQYVIVDDAQMLADLAKRVSYKFAYAPACIVALYDPRFTVEHQSSVMTAGMEVENMLLKATELGLGTCVMAGFKKDEVIKRALHIPAELELLLLIAVGHPTDLSPYPIPKLPDDAVFHFNSYQGLKTLNGSANLADYSVKEVIEYRARIAPVYLERFRLRVYDDSYYAAALKAFLKNALPSDTASVLDVMSYDGMFIKMLREAKPDIAITASDYLQNNLDFFEKRLGTGSNRITELNTFVRQETYDAATFVFQADFTPDAEGLLKEAAACVRSGGRFYIATVTDTWYRRMRDAVRRGIRKMRGLPVNVYEGNPFYRIGPRTHASADRCGRALERFGFRCIASGTAASNSVRGNSVRYGIYEKASL